MSSITEFSKYIKNLTNVREYLYDIVLQTPNFLQYIQKPQLQTTLKLANPNTNFYIIPPATHKFKTTIEDYLSEKNIKEYYIIQLIKVVNLAENIVVDTFEILERTGYTVHTKTNSINSRVGKEIFTRLKNLAEPINKYYENFTKSTIPHLKEIDKYLLMTVLGGGLEIGRSCYLFRTPTAKFIIDMGQGFSEFERYPFLNIPEVGALDSINAIIITHPHLDHSGSILFLVRAGYRNPIYMLDSCRTTTYICFNDVYKLFDSDPHMKFDNIDLNQFLIQTVTKPLDIRFTIGPGVSIKFKSSNHILGGAAIQIYYNRQTVFFTSDFNWRTHSLLKPLVVNSNKIYAALVSEGTNINKVEEASYAQLIVQEQTMLEEILEQNYQTQATVLCPVLLMGRGQQMIWELLKIFRKKEHLVTKIYVDHSVADMFQIYKEHKFELSKQGIEFLNSIDSQYLELLTPTNLYDALSTYSIVVATSGMLEGGKIITCLQHCIEKPNYSLVLSCYQPVNTIGALLLSSKKDSVITFTLNNVQKVYQLKMNVYYLKHLFSGHAGKTNLLHFLNLVKYKKAYIIHSKPSLAIIKQFSKRLIWPNNLETHRLL